MKTEPISILPTALVDLPFSEKLTVWAMRSWVEARNRKENPVSTLAAGFRMAKARHLLVDVSRVISVLSPEETDRLDIRPVSHPQVSLGEQRILAALAAYQYGEEYKAANLYLAWWLPVETIRAVRDPLFELAMDMGYAGHVIRPRLGIRIDEKAMTHVEQFRQTSPNRPPAQVLRLHPQNNHGRVKNTPSADVYPKAAT